MADNWKKKHNNNTGYLYNLSVIHFMNLHYYIGYRYNLYYYFILFLPEQQS